MSRAGSDNIFSLAFLGTIVSLLVMGGSGGIFDEPEPEASAQGKRVQQRPLATSRHEYFETGRLQMMIGNDGLPEVAGADVQPEDERLNDTNFICSSAPGRPRCEHYRAFLTAADGVARGFGEMRQIRRFCKDLAPAAEMLELDFNVFACLSRSPSDAPSDAVFQEFEDRQKQAAKDVEEKSGDLEF